MKKCFIASIAVALTVTIGWTEAKGNTKTPENTTIQRTVIVDKDDASKDAVIQRVVVAQPSATTATPEANTPKAVVQAWLSAMVAGDAETAKSYITGLPEVLVDQVITGMIQYAKGQPLPTIEGEEINGDKAIVISGKNGDRIPLRKINGKWKIDLSITLEEPENVIAVEIKPGSPMEAMLNFYDAMIAGDVKRLKTLVTGVPSALLKDAAAEAEFFNGMIQGFQAITQGQGQRPTLSGETINGDTATVTNDQGMEFPFSLKKVDGTWRVNLAPMFQ